MSRFYKVELHGTKAEYEAEHERYRTYTVPCSKCVMQGLCDRTTHGTCLDTFLQHVVHVPPPRWRAEKGEIYWGIRYDGCIEQYIERGSDYDDRRYANGNYFRTRADVESASDAIDATLEKWHAEREGASDD